MSMTSNGQFRLEAVYRLACSQEDQLSQRVALREQAHRSEEVQMEYLRGLYAKTLEEDGVHAGRVSVPRLVQAELYADALLHRIRLQVERLDESRKRLQEGRSELLAASQRRRMLEKLKDQHEQRQREHEDHLEVVESSEVSTTQFLRRRAEEAAVTASRVSPR